MKKIVFSLAIAFVGFGIVIYGILPRSGAENKMTAIKPSEIVELPEPKTSGQTSIEETIAKRRSVRSYQGGSVTLQEVSQLLWSAQGITSPRGLRAAPSAGALYPLELYLIAGNVSGLSVGIYKYRPERHQLEKIASGDLREGLSRAALGQRWVKEGACVIVFAAVYERVTSRYGRRGVQYVDMEVGHAVENVHLQVVPLGLGTVVIGAFRDEEVKKVLGLPEEEEPVALLPIGRI